MNAFTYYMPAKVFFGRNCIINNKEAFCDLGKKALIFTGRHSAKINGSLKDVTDALDAVGIGHVLFDEVEENPSLETIEKAAGIGLAEGADFVIGIGGGSPMDAAKGASYLLANPGMSAEMLMQEGTYKHTPIAEVATTAGTGSETTQYAVFTLHKLGTKNGATQKAFADIAFLDAKYTESLSDKVTINTAVDALTHLIEGYTSKKANYMNDRLAESGLAIFAECMPAIKAHDFTPEIREKLLLMSTIAGIVIAQAGTSLPHACGYMPTYEKGIAHGRANAIFTRAYLELFPDQTKPNKIIEILGFDSLESFNNFLKSILDPKEEFTEADVERYTDTLIATPGKLALHPDPLTREQVYEMYRKSLLVY
ncbi:MAG: iron-containing alcohol dehydrogenase family protein [Clostridia bacterium]|nr:iron-containing alcohol dehydrogenase family protein [Clostridia bacterium]